MIRRLLPLIISIFIAFFAITSQARPSHAACTPAVGDPYKCIDEQSQEGESLNDILSEFCEKRKGTQMNLETWYSGKCTDNTFSGEGVGFSDIVLIDLAEKINGSQSSKRTTTQIIKDLFKTIKEIEGQSSLPSHDIDLAISNARQEMFSQSNQSSLIGTIGKGVQTLFQNTPASSTSYLAYVSNNLSKHKIIPEALAAQNGVGFKTFSPFLKIWVAFRNLAYMALVVFFVVYGFMMMFRVNLGQKTVISVQLAIPKLIITLLIITFSYAIVGLIYDLMWVLLYFFFGYLSSQNIISNATVINFSKTASGMGATGFIGSFVVNWFTSVTASILGVTGVVLGGGIQTAVAGLFSLKIFGFIIGIILMFAVLISYAKLFAKLFGAFISVCISLITSPIVLLGNAFPGSDAIGTWLRSIVANLSVFPITAIFLLFSYLLMVQPLIGTCDDGENIVQDIFGTEDVPSLGTNLNVCGAIFGVTNLIEGSDNPLESLFWDENKKISGIPIITGFAGVDARSLLALMGVGLLLMAAKYVDMVRDALKVPPFKYGSAIGDALKFGVSMNDAWAAKSYQVNGRDIPIISKNLQSKYYKKSSEGSPTWGKTDINIPKTMDNVKGK